MPERNVGVGEHPSAEMLSAYVDGTLEARERGHVETHLAACEDCYELVTEVVASEEEIDAERDGASRAAPRPVPPALAVPREVASPEAPSPKVLPFTRRRWVSGAAALAAAATLFLVVQGPGPWRSWFGAAAPQQRLAQAVGEQRYVQGRLSGGFRFGPLALATRSSPRTAGSNNLTLLALAGEFERAAANQPTWQNLQAYGAALTLLGDSVRGTEALENAAALQSDRAELLNDVAVALIARHQTAGNDEDLVRAGEYVERALVARPSYPEAQFNRALILTELGLTERAIAAWKEYLSIDGTSPWSDVARESLGRLQLGASLDDRFRPLLASDAPEALDLQAIREYVEDVLLPAWATSVDRSSPAAPTLLGRISQIAGLLGELQEDRLLIDAVAQIERASGRGDAATVRQLAEAHACFGRLRALFAAAQMENAATVAEDCRNLFASLGSPFEGWTIVYQVRSLSFAGRPVAAAAVGRELSRFAHYPLLRARDLMHTASGEILAGRLATAISPLEQAVQLFEGTTEAEHLAAAHETLASTYFALGDRVVGWRRMRLALKHLPYRRDSIRRYATLTSAGMALLQQGYPRIARLVFEQNLEEARHVNGTSRLAETHQYIARAALTLGDRLGAAQSVESARLSLATLTAKGLRARIEAELLLTEADLLAVERPADAVEKVREARELLASQATYFQDAKLLYFEALAARTVDPERARSALGAAMDIVERRGAGLQQGRLRSSFRALAADVYRAGLDAAIADGDENAALEILERAHLGRRPERDVVSLLTGVKPGISVLIFGVTESSILRWSATQSSGLAFTRILIERSELRRLVAETRSVIVAGADLRRQPSSQRLAALLFDGMPAGVASSSTWIVCPDAELSRLPFAALPVGNARYAVDRHDIVAAGSVSRAVSVDPAFIVETPSLSIVASPTGGPDDPLLPAAGVEAAAIQALYPGARLTTGAEATKAVLLNALSSDDMLHFAGHAVVNSADPWRSHLRLATSSADRLGLLTAEEIARQQVSASIVVLAACSTADGPDPEGVDVLSVAGAFGQAGVPWVIGTFWDVSDGPTRDLFVMLHRQLASGIPLLQAVRNTQVALSKNASAQRDWAAITLIAS